MTSEQVIVEIDKAGYRPAKIEELLALGEAQPDLQRQFPIVALGSVWRDSDGSRYVPYLSSSAAERGLSLHCFGRDWSGLYRFLGRRK
jgi:hypothetical protein